eukprot:scaffold2072_cov126-Isochrysis_galbana.AAC.14
MPTTAVPRAFSVGTRRVRGARHGGRWAAGVGSAGRSGRLRAQLRLSRDDGARRSSPVALSAAPPPAVLFIGLYVSALALVV